MDAHEQIFKQKLKVIQQVVNAKSEKEIDELTTDYCNIDGLKNETLIAIERGVL